MKLKNETNETSARALEKEELENVNGGMKVGPIKSPQDMEAVLKYLFNTKREE